MLCHDEAMHSSPGHSLIQFIDDPLLRELEAMVKHAGFLAFGQIALGIEFLGACKDEFAFEEERHSRTRFEMGITEYMAKIDSRYSSYGQGRDSYLYKGLRCGMAHLVRPQGGLVGLTCDTTATHLQKLSDPDAVVIVLKPFFDDFKKACELLKKDIPNLIHPKIQGTYLSRSVISSDGTPVSPAFQFPKSEV